MQSTFLNVVSCLQYILVYNFFIFFMLGVIKAPNTAFAWQKLFNNLTDRNEILNLTYNYLIPIYSLTKSITGMI